MSKAAFLLTSLLLVAHVWGAKEKQPNMVVVLVDDHAFETISAYGTYLKDFAKTPAIEIIASTAFPPFLRTL